MTKNEFLDQLDSLLAEIPLEDRNDILYDYDEHFRIGIENGKSEEEIATSLGDIRVIAKQFKTDYKIKHAEINPSAGNAFRAVLATAGMGFFNLVFVLGPFLALLGLMIALFASAAAIFISGIGLFAGIFISPLFPSLVSMPVNTTFSLFASIGLTCFGALFFISDCYLARFFYKITMKYLKWNIEIIKK